MAEFTKDGITISPGSGTGSAELKVKVTNPPYQGFDSKIVEFTVQNTDYSVSKSLEVELEGIGIWQWGENFDNPRIEVGSSVEDLTISVTGKGNVLKYQKFLLASSTSLGQREVGIKNSEIFRSFRFFIPSIDPSNPLIDLPEGFSEDIYFKDIENWPDENWVAENGPIYEWEIQAELVPLTQNVASKLYLIEFLPSSAGLGLDYFLKINQAKTNVITLDPTSVIITSDGTESSVQLSTVGAWTVE